MPMLPGVRASEAYPLQATPVLDHEDGGMVGMANGQFDHSDGGEDSASKQDKMRRLNESPTLPLTVPFAVVPGEFVRYLGSTRDCGGVVALSNYRLHIASGNEGSFVNVPLSCIESTEARDMFYVHVNCKDGRYYRVAFGDNAACEEWQRRISSAVNSPAAKMEQSFALAHYAWAFEAKFEDLDDDDCCRKAGGGNSDFCWFKLEVCRLNFDLSGSWRISNANKDFGLCATYPPDILVPASISDAMLEKVASFRSARRVPAVVWRHPKTGAVLARCSQPEVGWLGWRSAEDEDLIRAISDACAYDQPDVLSGSACSECSSVTDSVHDTSVVGNGIPSLKDLSAEAAAATAGNADGQPRKVLIVDARSYTAAVGNRARGGGVECIEYYPTAEIIFMSLANIHSIRKSFQALRGLCNQTSADAYGGGSGWFAALDATKWLHHGSGLLKAATRVATALHTEARPVLVHCSDGWDRTPQIVSLAQLMLDPYYRSMDGFRILVEKEWLDFGHKMADRCGTVTGVADPNERAPIFLQWLDCVHQLLLQFPCHFEFNLSYLVKLAQHTYSSLFGTFLCNSLQERRSYRLSERTRSVWSYLAHHPYKFRNFLYASETAQSDDAEPLWPRCEVRDLLLWKDVYVAPEPSRPAASNVNNGNATNSSSGNGSGQESRSGGVSSSEQLDSGANSSRDGSEHGGELKRQDIKLVRDELEKLQVNGSEKESSPELRPNGDPSVKACDNDASITADGDDDGTEPRTSSVGSIAQHRLRRHSRAIESSTDTLVPESDVEERLKSRQDNGGKTSQNETQQQASEDEARQKCLSDHYGKGKGKSLTEVNNSRSSQHQRLLQQRPLTFLGGDVAEDIRLYFEAPLDTDGLAAHHNEVQERLVKIFAAHQTEVQTLRRDLQWTRIALLRQKAALKGDKDDLLGIDNDEAAAATAAAAAAAAAAVASASGPGAGHSGSSSTGAGSDASSTWEAVDERETKPTLWVPDHAASACMKCNTNFWFGRRKHHCRNCGRLFCSDCSDNLVPIPTEQLYHPVRVCDECLVELGELEQPLEDEQRRSEVQQDEEEVVVADDEQHNNVEQEAAVDVAVEAAEENHKQE